MEENHPISSTPAGPRLRVTFAPDFRSFGPYQRLLGEGLGSRGTEVSYLTGYRRGMPLYRAVRRLPMDILHMHYPVHYFERYNKWNGWRKLRFIADLHLSTLHTPLIYTVHDLYPLDEAPNSLLKLVTKAALQRASALIVHSKAGGEQIQSMFGRFGEKCAVIPHGDLSVAYGPLPPRQEAREKLGLGDEKICLMFGRLTPNKGLEEIIEFWKHDKPQATLAVVGSLKGGGYDHALEALVGDTRNILLKFGFQSDEQLKLWFAAADCVAINYGKIYTSGVASLARLYGIPVLVPARHTTVDLEEPHPSVFRFDSPSTDFGEKLKAALQTPPSYAAAAEWRKTISWDAIAAQTRDLYERVLKDCKRGA